MRNLRANVMATSVPSFAISKPQIPRHRPLVLRSGRFPSSHIPCSSRFFWRCRNFQICRSTPQEQDTGLQDTNGKALAEASPQVPGHEGPSTDLSVIWDRLVKLGLPFWLDEEEGNRARLRLALVVGLTLGTTGVSVLFNFLGRDFFNALSEKDPERFTQMLVKWLGGVCLGVPVYVFRDYFKDRLALEWREYMTRRLTEDYFANRTFYQVQAGSLVDNPDQRIASDVRQFTETALGFSMTLLNAGIDLISFSGILYSIYPPLFIALLVYSIGGTAVSIRLGKPLVGLNFQQEAKEANFRYGLVRVRENAESIAFYGGEHSEERLLFGRLASLVENYAQLLVTSRNLQFFTSFYRFLIQILPAAVVAPLFFQGKIEFGVINQSSSAFNHILTDISLVVYQFETLAGFSAVIDRLGEFTEVVDDCTAAQTSTAEKKPGPEDAERELPEDVQAVAQEERPQLVTQGADSQGPVLVEVGPPLVASNGSSNGSRNGAGDMADAIVLVDIPKNGKPGARKGDPLLLLDNVTLRTPDNATTLVESLNLQVREGESLLIVGPSGAGKTSILRAIAGLWSSGSGTITRYGTPVSAGTGAGDIFFVPQRPYMVLGTLRDQLLYPMWANPTADAVENGAPASVDALKNGSSSPQGRQAETELRGTGTSKSSSESNTAKAGAEPGRPIPTDAELEEALRKVHLDGLLRRGTGPGASGLDLNTDWASMLSLGEQQRLALARVLLAKPKMVLLDESTSALDTTNEDLLYRELAASGITYVSVGHRPTLASFHNLQLRITPGQMRGGAPGLSSWQLQQTSLQPLDA